MCCFLLLFFFFFSSPSFLAWLSITSVTHTAAGWTGMLYNLPDVTVVLRGTAQRSSQIFMSPKICCHLMTFHLPRARGCGVALLGGNVASPLWVSHKDSLLPFFFPAHMDNLNSCRLADFSIFWQVFSVYCDFFPFVMKTHTLCVPGFPHCTPHVVGCRHRAGVQAPESTVQCLNPIKLRKFLGYSV